MNGRMVTAFALLGLIGLRIAWSIWHAITAYRGAERFWRLVAGMFLVLGYGTTWLATLELFSLSSFGLSLPQAFAVLMGGLATMLLGTIFWPGVATDFAGGGSDASAQGGGMHWTGGGGEH